MRDSARSISLKTDSTHACDYVSITLSWGVTISIDRIDRLITFIIPEGDLGYHSSGYIQ